MEKPIRLLVQLLAFSLALADGRSMAQPVVRLPQTGGTSYPSGSWTTPGSPSSTLGAPAFDPYAPGGAAAVPPALNAAPPGYGTPPPAFPGATGTTATPYGTTLPPGTTVPPTSPPGYLPGAPSGSTGVAPNSQPYPGYGFGAGPSAGVPANTPPSLFPNGMQMNWGAPSLRFLTPRLRYSYVNEGSGEHVLGIHDIDTSVAAAFPNFMWSTQPLFVVPSFSLHLWSGPMDDGNPAAPNADLPANAYSAFLDFGWASDPAKPLGAEVGVRMGLFTDFDTMSVDSGRIMGQGLFRLAATPALTVRGGVIYLDRNRFKLFPAFGVLWTPNPRTRFDVFFPKPKLAQQLTTIGTQDIWWYVGGEYGGGAWSIKRPDGLDGHYSDQVDINDIRVSLGFEWGQAALLQQGRHTGFFEVAWVTERELVYVARPQDSVELEDSFMLRIGVNY